MGIWSGSERERSRLPSGDVSLLPSALIFLAERYIRKGIFNVSELVPWHTRHGEPAIGMEARKVGGCNKTRAGRVASSAGSPEAKQAYKRVKECHKECS
jgi:hypothetical protein